MNRSLILFAKEPQFKKVKSRLHNVLTAKKTVQLYQAFLKDMLELSRKIDCEKRFLAYQVENNRPVFLEKYAWDFILFKQEGKDLGERMYHTFQYAKALKATHMVMIGSDLPNLPHYYIQNAFESLKQYDVVLGPSLDGGYYLIGLNDPCITLFQGIQWGSNQVFSQTRKKINFLSKKLAVIKPWYDIDNTEQLQQLKQDLLIETNPCIARWTRKTLSIS